MANYHANQQNMQRVISSGDRNRTSTISLAKKDTVEKTNIYIKTKSGSVIFHGMEIKNPEGAYISL